ncbi:hypothetical protein RFI_16450 [Reticulomyxa filosa]|uniref:Uncharacterized protein n=1 Tax=Reticulomyxa filosa TaxID=46433 RepID=X6N629_RETFI|nr:hypothetical protein RFI_16450 [Reticulomyxa filosa]|eukprot:ETO20767.1 hypothetical protein RFI_16450 [Reticulomyxa filosa]
MTQYTLKKESFVMNWWNICLIHCIAIGIAINGVRLSQFPEKFDKEDIWRWIVEQARIYDHPLLKHLIFHTGTLFLKQTPGYCAPASGIAISLFFQTKEDTARAKQVIEKERDNKHLPSNYANVCLQFTRDRTKTPVHIHERLYPLYRKAKLLILNEKKQIDIYPKFDPSGTLHPWFNRFAIKSTTDNNMDDNIDDQKEISELFSTHQSNEQLQNDLKQWLRERCFSEYFQVFIDNGFDRIETKLLLKHISKERQKQTIEKREVCWSLVAKKNPSVLKKKSIPRFLLQSTCFDSNTEQKKE